MFQVGEYVVYGYSGVCLVEEITKMEVPGTRDMRMYYALRPVQTKSSRVYAPVDGRKPLRAVMSKEEAEQFIAGIPEIMPLEIPDDKHREECYKEAMKTCDAESWVRIIKTLCRRKQERADMGKQCTAMDSRYWKSAEEYLHAELRIALGLQEAEVADCLEGKLKCQTGSVGV